MTFSATNLSSRHQKAVHHLNNCKLDALIVCSPESLYYLCGFSGSDGALIVFDDNLVFLTDSRYVTQAKSEVFADSIVEYSVKTESIVAELKAKESVRVGFDSSMSVAMFDDLKEKSKETLQWCPIREEIQCLRIQKDEAEIERILHATEINRLAFEAIQSIIRPGVKEKKVAFELELAMRERGADHVAFDIIVASGERGALPHGIASDKILAEGELVTLDFGCRYNGYHSDETITLAIGAIPSELETIFETVLKAHDLALATVSPGVDLQAVDRIARDYIDSKGYGKYFGHGLGHGVGLEVHEAPVVSPRSQLQAETGMVFTIEPGIYVPGLGGVRIEDMVLVTPDGCQVLTKIPKTFQNILIN
jgi:Xaa-Pro aminopeptidase